MRKYCDDTILLLQYGTSIRFTTYDRMEDKSITIPIFSDRFNNISKVLAHGWFHTSSDEYKQKVKIFLKD